MVTVVEKEVLSESSTCGSWLRSFCNTELASELKSRVDEALSYLLQPECWSTNTRLLDFNVGISQRQGVV